MVEDNIIIFKIVYILLRDIRVLVLNFKQTILWPMGKTNCFNYFVKNVVIL